MTVPTLQNTTNTTNTPKRLVVLDPGHNGDNAAHPDQIGAQVPDGRGSTKACNTPGTATSTGYPEHAFNWDVALRVQAKLRDNGFEVELTRSDDHSVGPCVDQRAQLGNDPRAAAVVSIHADGSTRPGNRGFHIAYSAPPLNDNQSAQSPELATALRDSLMHAGFAPSNYVGDAGMNPRPDLAGLNLSTRPAALVECANMLDPVEAATVASDTGRQQYADAITTGIETFLR